MYQWCHAWLRNVATEKLLAGEVVREQLQAGAEAGAEEEAEEARGRVTWAGSFGDESGGLEDLLNGQIAIAASSGAPGRTQSRNVVVIRSPRPARRLKRRRRSSASARVISAGFAGRNRAAATI